MYMGNILEIIIWSDANNLRTSSEATAIRFGEKARVFPNEKFKFVESTTIYFKPISVKKIGEEFICLAFIV